MKTDAIRKCIELAFVDSDRCNSDTTILQASAFGELEAIEKENAALSEAARQSKKWLDMGVREFMPDWMSAAIDTTYVLLDDALKLEDNARKESDEKEPMIRPD